MSRRHLMLGAAVLSASLLLAGHIGSADGDADARREAFYARVDALLSTVTPNWSAVLTELDKVRPEYVDYRFFEFRALTYYALGQISAGDGEREITLVWATTVPADEQARIKLDLDRSRAATSDSLAVALKKCPGVHWSGADERAR